MSTGTSRATFGVVVLTQGHRPAELARALESVLAQRDVTTDIVCVGNGWAPVGMPPGVRSVALPRNLGIPAGRNAGVDHVTGELLFFLDDDACLPDAGFLAEVSERFREHPRLGLLQARVDDPDGSVTPRRWVPRLGNGDRYESGPVFSVWEGALAARRSVFEAAGRWPAEFFYAHEGIELAWRVWDTGHVVWYAGDLRVQHPVIDPERHAEYYRLNARNRVWLARRNLPLVLRPVYVGAWTFVQLIRSARRPAVLRAWFGGWWEGWSTPAGEGRTMSWRTVVAMTRRGRPPVI